MSQFSSPIPGPIAALSLVLVMGACTSGQVIDNSVGLAAGATKVVAKTAVGAGKVVYRGGKRVVVGPEQ
jgi:hypothetical protein